MPGELNDPEQSYPFYYDPKYPRSPDPYHPGVDAVNDVIQGLAEKILGRLLSIKEIIGLKDSIEWTGCLNRNPGDSFFVEKVTDFLKRYSMAKRVLYAFRFK